MVDIFRTGRDALVAVHNDTCLYFYNNTAPARKDPFGVPTTSKFDVTEYELCLQGLSAGDAIERVYVLDFNHNGLLDIFVAVRSQDEYVNLILFQDRDGGPSRYNVSSLAFLAQTKVFHSRGVPVPVQLSDDLVPDMAFVDGGRLFVCSNNVKTPGSFHACLRGEDDCFRVSAADPSGLPAGAVLLNEIHQADLNYDCKPELQVVGQCPTVLD